MSSQWIICGGKRHLGARPIISNCFSLMWSITANHENIFSVAICHAENVWLFWLLFWSKINISSHGLGAEGCGWLIGVLDSNYLQFCDMFGINNSMQIVGADVGCGAVNPPPPSQSSPPPQAIFLMASRKIIISWFPPLAGPNHHIGQHTRHQSLLLFLFISLVNVQ